MLSKKLFIHIVLILFIGIFFSSSALAIQDVDKDKINKLLDKGYLISGSHISENSCIDMSKQFSLTSSNYDRTNCFKMDNKYYFLKCDKSSRCDLSYLLKLNLSNTSGSINNNSSNIYNIDNFSKLYLFRTYNSKTGKYYLKYSTSKTTTNIVTHQGEYIDSIYIISNQNIAGTKALYLGGDGVDGYITYNYTNKLIGYVWDKAGDGRIAIYNCYKGSDHYISNNNTCNGNIKYNSQVFYVYPNNALTSISDNTSNNNLDNISGTVIADSIISGNNNLTIIANTQLAKNKISFCINSKNCIKLSSKWEEFKLQGSNTRGGYKTTILSIPSGYYEGYFQYIDANGKIQKSNIFKQLIKKSIDSNVTITSNQKVKAFFTIPEGFIPKFYINYNGGEYNIIEDGWEITKNNGLASYSQIISLYIKGIYNTYVTYGNNRINLNTISIK
ncbi:MAG: hypothetical protein Q8K30_03865 [Candidatus Gracilibacteria bacterium]|nr:hypothetical protein [Candidatus Gracilibacteria bacterium]